MRTLQVEPNARGYRIEIERGLLRSDVGARIREHAPAERAFVVTDENVARLYLGDVQNALRAAGYAVHRFIVPAGEGSKRLGQLGALYDAMADGLARGDIAVALGGGVVGDLTGFAAATYMRGMRYVQLPTTLLSQVDSAVGGKTAIDLAAGKNLVGAFHQPSYVAVDPDALQTLDDRQFLSGMGEVLKYALAFDPALLPLIGTSRAEATAHMDEIVWRCLNIKRGIVERDERDNDVRMLLNFGHTIAHAIEAAEHYEGLTHGEAVAAGMHLIARLGERAGLTEPGAADEIEALINAWGLPTTTRRALWPAMRAALARDKKTLNGALNAVLLTRIGEARIEPVSTDFFEGVTAWLK